MRTLTFYGASDDLFYMDGVRDGEPDEVDCYNRPACAKIHSSEGEVCVVAMYSPKGCNVGCWTVGLMPVDEDIPIPPWPVEFKLNEIRPSVGYSAELTIVVPDDALVSMVSQ